MIESMNVLKIFKSSQNKQVSVTRCALERRACLYVLLTRLYWCTISCRANIITIKCLFHLVSNCRLQARFVLSVRHRTPNMHLYTHIYRLIAPRAYGSRASQCSHPNTADRNKRAGHVRPFASSEAYLCSSTHHLVHTHTTLHSIGASG